MDHFGPKDGILFEQCITLNNSLSMICIYDIYSVVLVTKFISLTSRMAVPLTHLS